MSNSIVLTIGEIVVDWISTQPGRDLKTSTEFHRALGGNATNVSVAVSRLGGSSRLIAKIGADVHADLVRNILIEERVDLDFLFVDTRYPTANCYGIRDSDDEALYYNWPKPNASYMLNEDDITYDAFQKASSIHATGISLTVEPRKGAVLKALEMARGRGVIVSFDASFPTDSHESIDDARKAMMLADIIKINLSELLYWTGKAGESCSEYLQCLQQCNFDLENPKAKLFTDAVQTFRKEHQSTALLVTFGAHGSIVVTDRYAIYSPPTIVKSVSSIGAGDAYIAAILFGLSERQINPKNLSDVSPDDWRKINAFANAVGALATTHVSAVGSLPNYSQVEKLIG